MPCLPAHVSLNAHKSCKAHLKNGLQRNERSRDARLEREHAMSKLVWLSPSASPLLRTRRGEKQCADDWRNLSMKDVILPDSRHPATANLLRETRPTWGVGGVNLLPSLVGTSQGKKRKEKRSMFCFLKQNHFLFFNVPKVLFC